MNSYIYFYNILHMYLFVCYFTTAFHEQRFIYSDSASTITIVETTFNLQAPRRNNNSLSLPTHINLTRACVLLAHAQASANGEGLGEFTYLIITVNKWITSWCK